MRAKIAKNVHVSFSLEGRKLTAEWEPRPRRLSRQMLKRYRLARDTFVQEECKARGINMMVVDDSGLRTFAGGKAGPLKPLSEIGVWSD